MKHSLNKVRHILRNKLEERVGKEIGHRSPDKRRRGQEGTKDTRFQTCLQSKG